MTAPRANIYAVAERAGVSIATVSRVQRGVGPVSTETRTRVERAIEDPATETSDATPTPAIVLVFAGIVLMAALPPIHRVHVYHRSDWL